MDDHVETLRRYNRWRRGQDCEEMQDPRVVGDAIDAACDKIDRLRAELALCKKDLRSISDALDDPRCDLTHTMAALVTEMKGELASERNKPPKEVAPDCRQCIYYSREEGCRHTAKCESGELFAFAGPIRLYATAARKGEGE